MPWAGNSVRQRQGVGVMISSGTALVVVAVGSSLRCRHRGS
jgi:hypothetical protein